MKPEERDPLAELTRTHAVLISPRAAALHPELAEVLGSGTPQQIAGNAWIVILPEQLDASAFSEILAPLMSGTGEVIFQEYGDKPEFASFERTAALAGLTGFTFPNRAYSLQGSNFRALLRQLIAHLAGMEQEAVSDEKLMQVEEALGVGAQA